MTAKVDEHQSALLTAAVCDVFEPSTLNVPGYTAAMLARTLIAHVDTSIEPDGVARWTLRPSVRARVLGHSPPAAVTESLARAGPPVATLRQSIFELWIKNLGGVAGDDGKAVESFVTRLFNLSKLPPIDEVRAVANWLRQSKWVTPSAKAVLKGVARRELAARLRIAAGPKFMGRTAELRMLGDVLDAKSTRIATIEALGGMGKSALIAQTLIERHAYLDDARVIVGFLDFDAATVDPAEPATVIAALVDQLSPQVDGLDGYRESLNGILSGARQLQRDNRIAQERGSEDSRLLSVIHSLASELEARRDERRVVIILDTLERALHVAGRPFAAKIVEILWRKLLHGVGEASLVLAGRAIPAELLPERAQPIVLEPLEPNEAKEVLVGLGVPEERSARAAKIIVGVPLTLRLAARVLRDEGDKPLDDPELRAAVERERVNGYLYRRVLGHLPDARLSKLADPGLILRELTADAIVTVLGDSVDPAITTTAEASAVIDELVRMEDLFLSVHGRDQPTLRVRAELRADLIALLRADDGKFKAFNERAVGYYRELHTPQSEEAAAYHLLQLGRIDDAAHFLATAAQLTALADALDELPDAAAAWLRVRMASPAPDPEETEIERALRESYELEKLGRPAFALEQLLVTGPAPDSRAWHERVLHLARVTGDVDQMRDILNNTAISPLAAVIASEAAGISVSDELSRVALDEIEVDDSVTVELFRTMSSDEMRALLAIYRSGGSEAERARDLLVSQDQKVAVQRFAQSDPDLVRRYVAELGDRTDLNHALELELLDRTRDLDLTPLLDVIGNDQRALRLVAEGRREDKLSRVLFTLLRSHEELEGPIRDLLYQAVQHSPQSEVPRVAVEDRADALEAVADWLVANVPQDEWIALAAELIGSEASRFTSLDEVRHAARAILHQVDRRGLTDRFGRELMARYPGAVVLAKAFEALSDVHKAMA